MSIAYSFAMLIINSRVKYQKETVLLNNCLMYKIIAQSHARLKKNLSFEIKYHNETFFLNDLCLIVLHNLMQDSGKILKDSRIILQVSGFLL